jgi:iron complex outermembrane receptor protein
MNHGMTFRAAGLLAALLPLAAHGQAAPDTTAAVVLPGVTVTVLRAPVELARVPYAVSVNGAAEIQRAKPGLGLDEALRGIPGVQVDNRYNYALGERISIRGFGARAQFGVRGVKVLVDGIPATFADGQTSLSHIDLGTLRRAEVIRGPASALYGGSAGGVIQFETEQPPRAPFAQEVGVTGGANGLLRLHSATGGRRGRASYLVNLSRLGYDGYRDFSTAENLRLNARAGYQGVRNQVRVLVSAVRYDAQNPGSLSEELLRQDRLQAFARNRAQRTGEEGRQVQAGATWRHAMAGGEWETTGYVIGREIDNPIPPVIIALDRAASGVRTAFRGAPRPELWDLQWTAGVDTDVQSDDRRNFRNQQGERGALALDQRERVANVAGFFQLALEPLPRLTVLGGARYDWFRFRADDRLTTGDPDDSGSRTLGSASPSVGVSYRVGEPLTVYGNVATAFETPTTTELANRPSGAGGFNPDLRPQQTESYEAGARGRLGARAAYDLAAYHADVEGALIPFEVQGAEGRQFFRNAGSTTHRGVEASLTLAPLPRIWLDAAYTYTDARFGRYAVEGTAFDGNRVPGVAPHRAEVIASYGTPGGWFATWETRYTGEITVNDANTADSDAYWLTDVRAGVERIRLRGLELEPFVGVNNLFDTEHNTSVVVNAFGRRFFEPGPGRALYAGATLRVVPSGVGAR